MNRIADCQALLPALRRSVLTDPGKLPALRQDWLRLLGESDSNELMASPEWLLPWWEVFGKSEGRRLRIVLFHEGERLVGLAPFLIRRFHHLPGIPFRRLEPLGCGEHPSEQVCSDYLHVVAARGWEDAVARNMAAALQAGALGSWDELLIPGMDGLAGHVDRLGEACARLGLHVSRESAGEAPYIPLPDSWDGYLQQLSSSHRYFLRRSLRDFERWADGGATFGRVAEPADLREAQAALIALHGDRWSQAGHQGAFHAPRFREFHERLMPRLFRQGALELWWLRVRGQPIAALYNILWDNKIYFYQSGRKADLPREVRPGVVLHAHAIRNAIEAGRREYDFLAGASQYKGQLALARRPLVSLRLARPSLREDARRLVERGIDWARPWRDALRTAWKDRRGTPSPPEAGD